VDCGEGTQRQLIRTVGLADITDVFLTHLHLDHWWGLPPMIKTFELRDRDRPLRVYGPPGTEKAFGALGFMLGKPSFGLEITDLGPYEDVVFDDYVISAVRVQHRTETYGYALVEDERPGRFDAERATELGVEPGPDFGRLQHGDAVGEVKPEDVTGPARPGRKVVFSGDTVPCESLRVMADGADLLVHEATFTDEERDRARATQHSTAKQAALLAEEAGVKMLALTHLSTRYGGREIKDEARAVFRNTVVPRDGDVVEIPLPEKGEPELIRGDEPTRPPAAA
jgi:ribonuclease Z